MSSAASITPRVRKISRAVLAEALTATGLHSGSITLAYMLRAIDDREHKHYRARIDQIYANFNAPLKQEAAA